MPGATGKGDRAGVDFCQCGSGKGKQTERYPQNMPKYMGLPSPSKKRNKSSSGRKQIKASRKSYGTGTQMAEKSHPSSSQLSHQSKLGRQEMKNYIKHIFCIFFHKFHIPQAGATLTLTPFVQLALPSAAFKNPKAAPNGFDTNANFLCWGTRELCNIPGKILFPL